MITLEIIEDCKKGRHQAQRKLFDFFSGPLYSLCLRYMNDEAEAEDMVSQAFTRIFRAIGAFEYHNMAGLRAWIKRIAVNECLMRLRRVTNFSLISLEDDEAVPYHDDALGRIEAEYIFTMLRELPPGYRTILNLYAIEGYTHPEIAEILGIHEGTSRSQLNKARKLMKEKLLRHDKSQHGKRKI
ncbi:RNA polymerase sigma factor [Hufsiella ginkgonis]|uniref:Sigma-70 family RNA polymerase sigma factor n=1 Tax=Hufsiella ginkgonis TaxID=2695274 RepID=A0A7K1XTK6_9SPHI|nr:sigma-70 family RNA polymerase sigma factor [Hufsiella ginkgonis]MXV14270.1 sigma-70 family RNA polymerase sigma factor [Hufsiella ginkgonis]